MEIVFTENNLLGDEPFTTDEVIAEYAEVKRTSVTRLIRKYLDDLKGVGKLGFQIRPSDSGQKIKIYHLNEQQATLIITYLDNTEPVRRFKKMLVEQFFIMKQELMKRQIIREMEKPVRKGLTDTIKEYMPDDKWAYGNITRLLCKTVTNHNPKQLKELRNAKNSHSLMDVLTSEEFESYQSLEQKVVTLIELGMDYYKIKEVISRKE